MQTMHCSAPPGSHDSPPAEPSLSPWLFRDASGQLVSCAWCERESGGKPPPNISHGICTRHFNEQIQALERPAERS